jgi:hypothetical protein
VGRAGETERQRDTQTERERERKREAEKTRQTARERGSERAAERESDRARERQSERDKRRDIARRWERRMATRLLIGALCVQCAVAKTEWNDPNPNPGWEKYYGGKCAELERCTEAGDLNCLQTSAIPLCNLEVQETRIEKPWQKVLGLAAAHGQLEVVQLFLNSPLKWWSLEAPINDSGENVLMHAAAHGEYEIVAWLLQQGADVRTQSVAGETARDLAAASENPARTLGALDKFAAEKTEALVKALRTNSGLTQAQMDGCLKGGADLTHVDEDTQLTPLGLAVNNGIVEATAKLLENNAPTHHVHPRTGHDIIHTACDRGHFHIVDLLVHNGADIQATTVQFEMNWCVCRCRCAARC